MKVPRTGCATYRPVFFMLPFVGFQRGTCTFASSFRPTSTFHRLSFLPLVLVVDEFYT